MLRADQHHFLVQSYFIQGAEAPNARHNMPFKTLIGMRLPSLKLLLFLFTFFVAGRDYHLPMARLLIENDLEAQLR